MRKFIEKENGKFYEIITSSGFPYMRKGVGIEVSEPCEQEVETSIRDFPINSHVKFAHLDYWCEIVEGNIDDCDVFMGDPTRFIWLKDLRSDNKSVIAKRIDGE
jgi:hypothetical protein